MRLWLTFLLGNRSNSGGEFFRSWVLLPNRARAREGIKPYLFSLWMVGITAKRTAIPGTRLALPIAGRGDVARSASPQDRRPTKQAERSGRTNPVQFDATALRA